MTTKSLLSLLFASSSLLACASEQPTTPDTPESIDGVLTGAGTFEEPPAPHGATPVGDPGQETLEYGDKSRWSCRTQRVSLQENPERFVTLNPNADIIYPGALVQGASLQSGSPDPIPVRRGAGKIVLTLVNGADANFQRSLDEVSQGNVVNAQNELLHGVENGSIPAKFVYDYELFDSEEKLAAAMDVRAEWLGGSSVHAAAEASSEHHVTRAVIRLTQEYFTTAFEMPTSAQSFFAPDVTASELAEFAGPGNPPAYISSVTYGRQFYLVFESTSSKQDLQAAVDAVYNGFVVDIDGHLKTELRQTQKETKVKVYAIGGDSESALNVAVSASNEAIDGGLFEALSAYLKKGGTFSTSNPGLPVSYTVRDVLHRNVVKVNLGTEFTERQCNPLINEQALRLSLDGTDAQYDSNGVMNRWPGGTVAQNEPTYLQNMRKGTDEAGRPWVQMDQQSYAAGLDCQAMAGVSTAIIVTRPDLSFLPTQSQLSILTGGMANARGDMSSRWVLGWNPDQGGYGSFTQNCDPSTGICSDSGRQTFLMAAQPNGHIVSTVQNPGNYMYQYANGVRLNQVTGSLPSAASMATNVCYIGAVGPWAPQGRLGEIRLYSGEITPAQREVVECELGVKWGIGVEGCKDGRPVKTY